MRIGSAGKKNAEERKRKPQQKKEKNPGKTVTEENQDKNGKRKRGDFGVKQSVWDNEIIFPVGIRDIIKENGAEKGIK